MTITPNASALSVTGSWENGQITITPTTEDNGLRNGIDVPVQLNSSGPNEIPAPIQQTDVIMAEVKVEVPAPVVIPVPEASITEERPSIIAEQDIKAVERIQTAIDDERAKPALTPKEIKSAEPVKSNILLGSLKKGASSASNKNSSKAVRSKK